MNLQEMIKKDYVAAAKWLLKRAEEVRAILVLEYKVLAQNGVSGYIYSYSDFVGLTEEGAYFSDDGEYPDSFTITYDLLVKTDDEIIAEARRDVNERLAKFREEKAKRDANIDERNKMSLKLLLTQYGHPDTWSK